MILKINSTRGHTGSLLVCTISDALLDFRTPIDSSCRKLLCLQDTRAMIIVFDNPNYARDGRRREG